MSPDEKLMNLLESHATDDLYIGRNIPKTKLDNAIAHFPIDPKAMVIALIDCTVMGSCKNGLAITDYGLIWKNDWTTKSSKTYLSWEEFLDNKSLISIDKYDLILGNNLKLNMSGSRMSKVDAFNLFHALADLMTELIDETYNKTDIAVIKPKEVANVTLLEAKFSGEEQVIYKDTLIAALALMTVADDEVDEKEVALVSDFINEEELIEDKHQALLEYEAFIEKLITSRSKSTALFKLQTEKMLAKAKNLKNRELIDRLKIMLEGMGGAVGGSENVATVEVMQRIMKSLN